MSAVDVETEVAGNVWKLVAAPGHSVQAGEVLLILESMKMEIPVEAPAAGTLLEFTVQEEEQVEEDQVVARIELSS